MEYLLCINMDLPNVVCLIFTSIFLSNDLLHYNVTVQHSLIQDTGYSFSFLSTGMIILNHCSAMLASVVKYAQCSLQLLC